MMFFMSAFFGFSDVVGFQSTRAHVLHQQVLEIIQDTTFRSSNCLVVDHF